MLTMQNILNKTRKKKEGELANNYYICRGNQLFCLLNTLSFLLRIRKHSVTYEYCSSQAPTNPLAAPRVIPGEPLGHNQWIRSEYW